MPSKVFTVVIINCEDASHACKLCELLRASFRHRNVHIEPTSCACMVQADSPAAIRQAVSSELGNAKLICGEMSYLRDSGEMSAMPTDFLHFAAPQKR
jgi:hypothetical protein